MNNLMQRMPQSAKVALAAGLLAVAVGSIYYFFVLRPNQLAAQSVVAPPVVSTPAPSATTATPQPSTAAPAPSTQAPAPTAQPSTTARSLEVEPLPFLVTKAPSSDPKAAKPSGQTVVAQARPKVAVPPNPFVPLTTPPEPAQAVPNSVQANNIPNTLPVAARPTPAVVASPAPALSMPSQTSRVAVRQPQALPGMPALPTVRTNTSATTTSRPTAARPTPSVVQPSTPNRPVPAASAPVASVRSGGRAQLTPGGSRSSVPGSLSLGSGALPIRIAPLDRELGATASASVNPNASAALDTTNPDGSASSLDYTASNPSSPVITGLEPRDGSAQVAPATAAVSTNPLAQYVQQQNLKLANVILGSTNVAIFQSRDGYLVVPVGNTLPGSEILVKSLNTNEALLVQGSQELNLSIENP